MPNSTFTQILTSTLYNYQKDGELANQVINGLRGWSALKKKGCIETLDGGESIVVPAEYARNATAKWVGEYELLDLTPQDILTSFQFNYKMAAGTAVVSDQEEARNQGKNRVIALAKQKVKNLVESMQEALNTALYSDGTVASQPAGLEAIIATTGTYGGISRTTDTWARGNVTAVGGALTAVGMSTMYRTCSRNIWYPDLLMTTGAQYEKYEGIAVGTGGGSAYLRFNDTIKADLGFDALSYKGSPLFWDGACPSGIMYFLTTRFLKVGCHKDHMFTPRDPERHPFQLATIHACTWYGAIWSSCPNTQGKLTGLT